MVGLNIVSCSSIAAPSNVLDSGPAASGAVPSKIDTSSPTPNEIDDVMLQEIAQTDWERELSDVTLERPHQGVWIQLSTDPVFLSSQIAQFCRWLKYEERAATALSGDKGLGWFPSQLSETRSNNQVRWVASANVDIREQIKGVIVCLYPVIDRQYNRACLYFLGRFMLLKENAL